MSKAAEPPAGRELDLLVHRALGLEPTKLLVCSKDGGESSIMATSPMGPYPVELRAWFASHPELPKEGYALVDLDDCPPYSTDPAAALEALARCIGTLYSPGAEQDGRKEWAAWAHRGPRGAWGYGDTPALAIARAVAAAGGESG